MGADHFVVTNPGFHENYQLELDIIISTRDAAEGFPLAEYLSCVVFSIPFRVLALICRSTLTVHGKFICVGLPDGPLPQVTGFTFLNNGCFFGGSHIGSKKEALEMMDVAVKKGVKPW
jgi:D-arabinose 1-dehydrogenase-like Zn-dependent alcohol dehydrogenase